MLMSPDSAAQYRARNVVIFDEVSEMPTCNAVGEFCRAKNAVNVWKAGSIEADILRWYHAPNFESRQARFRKHPNHDRISFFGIEVAPSISDVFIICVLNPIFSTSLRANVS